MAQAFNCVWCSRVYSTIGAWIAHTRAETVVKNTTKCPNCDTSFASNSLLKFHLTRRDCLVNFPKDDCRVCGTTFGSPYHRDRHQERVCIPTLFKGIPPPTEPLFTEEQARELDLVVIKFP